MPIIFAQALMFLPATFSMSAEIPENGFLAWLKTSFASSESMFGFEYNFVFFWMIVAFTYFYTAVTVNSSQMADDMKRNGGFIPGVKPGTETETYQNKNMTHNTHPESGFLAVILSRYCSIFE